MDLGWKTMGNFAFCVEDYGHGGLNWELLSRYFFFSTGQSTKKLGIFWEYVLIFELLGNSQEGYESILGERV